MKSICVNCGSNDGSRPEYLKAAIDLGRYLGENKIDLVYGGAGVGLMGAVASSAMESGGIVIGIIPESFAHKVANKNLTELYVVPTMHDRKLKMFDLSDGFIALPGGMGTIEEMFEILTWAQLGLHSKPCGLLNICGYYNSLLDFLENSVKQQFVRPEHRDMLLIDTDAGNLLRQFDTYKAPTIEKWINR
ncbi:MAG: TIGR00730 family Rossman fold protein [Tissierellales bacterium]|nr:TIGR00730 family Rossman fold protein [Tissierellales bacterium]